MDGHLLWALPLPRLRRPGRRLDLRGDVMYTYTITYDAETPCYIGHCLDLDVVSWADTPEGAMAAVLGSVKATIEVDEDLGLDPDGRTAAPAEYWPSGSVGLSTTKGPFVIDNARCDESTSTKRLWARMYSLHSMDALPAVFGPYASLGPLQEVPNGMPDPYDWIESMLQ